ncbi:hypothetical protein QUB05_24820 [Microcoleus sp. F10-C6]|uniref:hypothetical protein n=1 Tax=unclassified Microcoleus TaxID=2642155 RepID=UPI002FD4DC1E
MRLTQPRRKQESRRWGLKPVGLSKAICPGGSGSRCEVEADGIGQPIHHRMDVGTQPDECYVQSLRCLHPLFGMALGKVGADYGGVNHRVFLVRIFG